LVAFSVTIVTRGDLGEAWLNWVQPEPGTSVAGLV
jgi:hypothetical protein